MESVSTRRLPGVYVRSVTPPVTETLPRMDIASFVGLASTGPLDTPVMVEDAGRYREIFGPDLPLAWDARAGRTAFAFLGPAVEAFFRNGGKRCWVVRVAREPTTNLFAVPALVDAQTGRPTHLRARCGGSWSDGLRVGAVLQSETMTAHLRATSTAGVQFDADLASVGLEAGDVLRTTFDGDVHVVMPVIDVWRSGGTDRISAGQGRWFRRTPADVLPEQPVAAVVRSPTDSSADIILPDAILASGEALPILRFAVPIPEELVSGSLLHLTALTGPIAGEQAWFGAASTTIGVDGQSEVEASEIVWPFSPSDSERDELADAVQVTEKLSFSLLVWQGQEITSRLESLSFAAPDAADRKASLSSRFWGELPADDDLFAHIDGRPRTPSGLLEREAASPRFPLAGPESTAPFYLPLGMPRQPGQSSALPARNASGVQVPALERDGLVDFSPTWFLDADLSGIGLRALPGAVADALYLQQRAPGGLHSLWPLDEVTLLAAPDAVQAGWIKEAALRLEPLEAPEPPFVEAIEDGDGLRIAWQNVVQASAEFELAISVQPDFALSSTLYRGQALHTYLYPEFDCIGFRYARLRYTHDGRMAPWSATLVIPPSVPFTPCRRLLDAPALSILDGLSLAAPTLVWSDGTGADRYALESSGDPAFAISTVVAVESATTLAWELDPPPAITTYYRVRAERDGSEGGMTVAEISPWSTTVLHDPAPEQTWTMRLPEDFDADGRADELLAFQRAMLRFAAARADIVSVLSLPAHFREERTASYVGGLTPDVSDDDPGTVPTVPVSASGVHALSLDEARALSYGALYHPWLAVRDGEGADQAIRFTPPDGALVGLMAARALSRGAWVAPANVPLRNALALAPAFDAAAWSRLLDRQVNVLRPTPNGFMPLSAETLSASADLQPLNVRRLLILLRRLAIREGDALVFESNDAALRRRIRLQFEDILERLFKRGAFAGRQPDEAFQVRTDTSVNPPEHVDRGRLVVELRVAPSQPLKFLAVRLVELDGVGLTTMEA